jgi:hypothetical protein
MELIESWESQDFSVPSSGAISASKLYYVTGTNSATDVYHFLGDELPRIFGGLPLTSFDVSPLGPLLYSCKASYGITASSGKNRTNVEPPPIEGTTGEASYAISFSTTGGTFRRQYAVENNVAFGTSPPSSSNKIGDNGREIEGVDVVIPQLQFNIRKRKPGAQITLPYINTIVSLTGTTNNASFLGFAAGELLFLGAEGQQVSDGDTEITFTFSAQPNAASVNVGGITVTDKKGHEYIWTYSEPSPSGGLSTLKAVYKSKIYNDGNFSLLGIT